MSPHPGFTVDLVYDAAIPRWASAPLLSGPAWQSWREAWDHIETRTLAGVPEAVQQAVLRSPVVAQLHDAMSVCAAHGEVAQVQAHAQQWLKAVKKALVAHRKEAA